MLVNNSAPRLPGAYSAILASQLIRSAKTYSPSLARPARGLSNFQTALLMGDAKAVFRPHI